MIRHVLIAIALLLTPQISMACGPDSDCVVGDRSYRIQMPETTTNPGAIVFAHGYRGSSVGTMRNQSLRRLADRLGVALIAVASAGDDWQIPGVPNDPTTDGAAEMRYFETVIADAQTRFGIDADRLMMSGFSAGGMVTWQLACTRGDLFAGFAPIAGTFWSPVPDDCTGFPVHMFHTHGTSDRIVPLEGRAIAQTRQGSVTQALEMLRKSGTYSTPQSFTADGMDCMRETGPNQTVLEFCTHPGGHSVKMDYIERAWSRLEELGAV